MKVEISTLTDFFGVTDDAKQMRKDAGEIVRTAKSAFAHGLSSPLREVGAESALYSARALLDSPIAGILADGWKTAHDLQKFCDPHEYPPGKVGELTLREHEIALRRNPVVEVTLDGAPTGVKLHFELKLAVTIASAVLKIRDARIIGARVGDCRGAGRYACYSVTLAERKSGKFRLPGEVSFGQGVAIPLRQAR